MELLTVRVLNLQTQCMLGNISTWPCVQQVVKRDVRMKVFIEFYTESPGPPSDLSLSNVTNTSALLSWPPPNYGGGDLSLRYSIMSLPLVSVGQLFLLYF